jgi:hypothetical protein
MPPEGVVIGAKRIFISFRIQHGDDTLREESFNPAAARP